jgi:uncharacterized cupredoxin-like copper-binding protein
MTGVTFVRLLGFAVLISFTLSACSVLGRASAETVEADLTEWSVRPTKAEVQAGRIRFVGHNRSTTMVHELAVISIGADGKREEVADVEGLRPGASGEFVARLEPGTYELACLIAPGEEGSTVDHYQMGMHTPFSVR